METRETYRGRGTAATQRAQSTARLRQPIAPPTDGACQQQWVRRPLLWENRDNPAVAAERQIMLDIDETIFSLHSVIGSLPGGERVKGAKITNWGQLGDLLGTSEQMFDMFRRATSFQHASRQGLYAGCRGALETIAAHGGRIQVVTHRDPVMTDDTQRFLQHFQVPHESLTVSLHLDKVQHCVENSIPVVVDDKPTTIEEARAAGLHALALQHGYNHQEIARSGAIGASNWVDLGNHVLDAMESAVEQKLHANEQKNT